MLFLDAKERLGVVSLASYPTLQDVNSTREGTSSHSIHDTNMVSHHISQSTPTPNYLKCAGEYPYLIILVLDYLYQLKSPRACFAEPRTFARLLPLFNRKLFYRTIYLAVDDAANCHMSDVRNGVRACPPALQAPDN